MDEKDMKTRIIERKASVVQIAFNGLVYLLIHVGVLNLGAHFFMQVAIDINMSAIVY